MTFFAFLAALAVAVIVYEVVTAVQTVVTGNLANPLRMPMRTNSDLATPRKRTMIEAILLAAFPKYFDENEATNITDVVSLLRRSGYVYATPGEFYAAAIRDFSQYLMVGAALSVFLVILDMAFAAVPILAFYIFIGLRRPFTRLKNAAKKRELAMKNNMLLGLSVLESLLTVSTGSQTAFTEASRIGGPFCNLLALLSVQIEKSGPDKAIEVVREHLPNPKDIEANLFLVDVLAFYKEMRPILSSITALRESVHRLVLEDTEERAALVRQRANLFGILSVIGLLLALVAPYLSVGF